MTKPLALCCYENLLLGNQLVNRLQDLGYRVHVADDPSHLVLFAIQQRPFLVITDLTCRRSDICMVISELRKNGSTQHIPILAFAPAGNASLHATAHASGATLVAVESGLLHQLPDLLEQVLAID